MQRSGLIARVIGAGLVLVLSILGGVNVANALELIVNGGFEAGGGSFTGWTHLDQAGGGGSWFIQSGAFSPMSGFVVPPPPEPTHAAMTDQDRPGSHVLFQDFLVPVSLTSATLSFDRFIGNRDTDFFTPPSLDYTVSPNQQARVDILIGTPSSEFSVGAADILANLFQTHPGDPLVSGYTPQTMDLTSLLQGHQGQTLQLRFAEVDNLAFFQFGVDAVRLSVSTAASTAAVPAPTSLALALLGSGVLASVAIFRRRSR